MSLPQIGQLVQLRNMAFIVNDVAAASSDNISPACTKVILECVDNDRLGHVMEVIWERENEHIRLEILRRLLKLNFERHDEEANELGSEPTSDKKDKKTAKKKATQAKTPANKPISEGQGELF